MGEKAFVLYSEYSESPCLKIEVFPLTIMVERFIEEMDDWGVCDMILFILITHIG